MSVPKESQRNTYRLSYRRRPRKIGAAETAVATAELAVAAAQLAVATAFSAAPFSAAYGDMELHPHVTVSRVQSLLRMFH